MEAAIPFKKCGLCLKEWPTQAEFLADPEIRYEGYQACFEHPEAGLLLFSHACEKGGTTLTVSVDTFAQMAQGQRCQTNLSQDEVCPVYCFDPFETCLCPLACSMAWTREIVRTVAGQKQTQANLPRLHKYR